MVCPAARGNARDPRLKPGSLAPQRNEKEVMTMRKFSISAYATTEIDAPDQVKDWVSRIIENDSSAYEEMDMCWVLNTDLYGPWEAPFMYSISALASLAASLKEEGDPLAPEDDVVDWLEDHHGFILIHPR